MGLEFKHVNAYLPYELYTAMNRCGKLEPYLIYGIKRNKTGGEDVVLIDNSRHGDYQSSYLKGIRPILRPLSDFEDINSKSMIDLNVDVSTQIDLNELAIKYKHYTGCYYSTMEVCFRNHIDVFGLIEKGLAVDVSKVATQV